MKKSAVIALFAFAMLPFSACSNNSEQAAYMQSPAAEANAKEAEQAEEEFAQVSAVKVDPKTEKTTHESKRKPASTKEAHHAASAPAHTADSQKVWTVQLGAFKVKENAEKLTSKLKGDGFPVMMLEKSQSKSGELYLVHLEPTPNKSEAQKWQTDLKLKSFDSTLTSKQD